MVVGHERCARNLEMGDVTIAGQIIHTRCCPLCRSHTWELNLLGGTQQMERMLQGTVSLVGQSQVPAGYRQRNLANAGTN